MEYLNEAKVVKKMCKGCNWRERIIIRLNKRLFIKVYHKIRIEITNTFL